MIDLVESARAAWLSINAHRFRSFLTTLGIIIGVTAVIAVVAIVSGLGRSVNANFDVLGANSLSVHSYTSFDDALQGRTHRLTLEDYSQLKRSLRDIRDITPTFAPFGQFGGTVRAGDATVATRIYAVTANYDETFKIYPSAGRFLGDSDEASQRKVAVIGEKARLNLRLPVDCLGRFIFIGSDWFKIVGVMEKKGEFFGISQDDYVLIPFATGKAIAPTNLTEDIAVTLNVPDLDQIEAIQDRITQLLRRFHHLKTGEDDDFKVETAQQLKDSVAKVTNSISLVLASMVGISLIVGGIGIMNIMLVSVRERTKEIGICKALGAQRYQILVQYLVEASLLSLTGGVIGVILGWGLGEFARLLVPGLPPVVVPVWAALLAVGSSASIGIVFGVIPAAQAANLDPVDALRYE